MVTPTARRGTRDARYAARRAGNSKYVDWLARAGFVARGVMYIIIGILALEVAFGNAGHKADQSGAVRVVGNTPFGGLLLWLLVIGFAGMTLWRLSEALYGGPGADGRKTGNRLIAGRFRIGLLIHEPAGEILTTDPAAVAQHELNCGLLDI